MASPLTYSFYGAVTSSQFKPYGLTIPPGGPVSGQFTFDPDALATHTFSNGLGYDQHFTSGLHATIGGVSVSADEYLVEILNNMPQFDGSTKDEFVVSFSSGLSPALSSQLVVNGVARSAGLVNIAFVGSNTLYADASLPSSFNFADFPPGSGIFGDKPVGGIVTFSVVPEPASLILFISAAAMHGTRVMTSRWRKRT